ncbi:MAG: hypothetical protein CBC22_03720 [Alphaproteobacteria bacterium TMED62]|nr:MAG: hypothetical protein CBC22_03720 [Alphaproteobacteria bacterium TMED62]
MNINYSHRILITSAGGFLGLQNIEYFRKTFKHKIWILSADSRKLYNENTAADLCIQLPKGNNENYILQVIKYVKKYKINFILPCSDEEAIKLSYNLNRFEKLNVSIACQLPEINKIISNKIKTYEFLKKNNISTPDFRVVRSKSELLKFVNYFYNTYSGVVIKDPIARGNRGTIVIAKKIIGFKVYNESRELHMSLSYFKKNIKRIIKFNFPKILSERLFSPCYDLDVLAYQGKYLYSVVRERINPAGVPFKGNIIRKNKQLEELSKKIVALLSLSWLVDIDVMTKSNGEPTVIEINPRISGSAVISVIAGVPLYKNLLKLNINKKIGAIKYPKDGLKIVPKVVCEAIKTK